MFKNVDSIVKRIDKMIGDLVKCAEKCKLEAQVHKDSIKANTEKLIIFELEGERAHRVASKLADITR